MPVDPVKYGQPATRGDVADVALKAATGLLSIHKVLVMQSQGKDTSEATKEVWNSIERLSEIFDTLSGWTAE